jgi:hypothetical protein
MADPTVFDISQLDDNELGHLEFVLNSPSWAQVFEPYLVRISESLKHKLIDPSRGRKDALPDDFLRGGIAATEGLLAFFRKVIEETQIERVARARQTSPEARYHEQQQSGDIGPAGQTAPPLDPDEY